MSQKEREVFMENKFKEIANLISTKLVHQQTQRPFPPDTIEAAMKSINFKARMNDDTKKQAMECIKTLVKRFKVSRAKMLIRITIDKEEEERLMEQLGVVLKNAKTLEGYTPQEDNMTIESEIQPADFRVISILLENEFENTALEIVEQSLVNRTVSPFS